MLQWEIDASLAELTQTYGYDMAADAYRQSFAAASGLTNLIAGLRIPCLFRPRSTVFMAAGDTGENELRRELGFRHRAGMPGRLLSHRELRNEFQIDREAAILSPGSAEADPLLLAWSLLKIALSRGAALFEADALHFHDEGKRVVVETTGRHVIEADHVVLATGYVMPHFVIPKIHSIASSYALATEPQADRSLWPDRSLIWEASEPYLYLRTTADNRIIVGGEDEDIADPQVRDALLASKVETLQAKLACVLPNVDPGAAYGWCGAFGQTEDGLPLIGRVPGAKNIYAAYGYGGNGITFSYLASRMIASLISGQERPWHDMFAIDRDGPSICI